MAERAPRVLVVDDDAHVCEMLDRFLSQRGFDVQTAADGEEALRSVPNVSPGRRAARHPDAEGGRHPSA